MKILYLSSHAVLEADEIKLFTELGHDVFSMGAYQNNNKGGGLRGEIPGLYQNENLKAVALQGSKENIPQELLDWCDCVIMMHNATQFGDHPQPWIAGNWDAIKKAKKPCVFRSIGQSTRDVEKALKPFREQGLKIVRYSPKEDTIPQYQGSDALIRFYKDPTEYDGYTGDIPRIVNISQALFGGDGVKSRGDHMNLKEFSQVVNGFDWKVFGPNNEKAMEHNGGLLSFEDMKSMLRFNRVFLLQGTRPASYTLSMCEAMMTGMPIVTLGPVLGNSVYTDQRTYEQHEIIGKNGVAGYWSDSVEDLRGYCKLLLEDQELAKEVGRQGRLRAIQFFGKAGVQEDWKKFLDTL